MAKKVIVGGRIESKEVGGIVTGAAEILDDTKGKKQSVINQETDAELERLDGAKQNVLTFDNTPTEGSNNPVKSGGVYAADKALSDAIEAILLLIPSAASALNKLVDQATMNSSISTATATFRGTYNVVTDLELTVDATHEQIAAKLAQVVSEADNNDYAFVQVPVSAESTDIRRTERYKFNGTAWGYEYDLNTSGFTAAQWAAINSGITLALVAKLSGLPTSSELQTLLGQKQNTLTFDNIPTSGSANPVKSGGVYSAINDEKTAREQLAQSVAGINGRLGNVEEVIPSGAAANNKLVANSSMEAYVASIIQNITASFTIATADGHINLSLTQTNGEIVSLTLTSSDIASAQALTALTGRVTTAEGKISTNETDIAALKALYNALLQSAPQVIEPTDTWPVANPSGTVIYRVIDRVNTPPQYYSDYMWNGISFVLMATYNNAIDPRPKKASQNLVTSGGVFDNMGALDVSELNATENPHTLAQYVDLSAALAAIPTDYQKGGMSIKFVQSSDNKYVQYRLMSDTFNTTPANWQGVDDKPIYKSKNLLLSSATAEEIIRDSYLRYSTDVNVNSNVGSHLGYFIKDCKADIYGEIKDITLYSLSVDSNDVKISVLYKTLNNKEYSKRIIIDTSDSYITRTYQIDYFLSITLTYTTNGLVSALDSFTVKDENIERHYDYDIINYSVSSAGNDRIPFGLVKSIESIQDIISFEILNIRNNSQRCYLSTSINGTTVNFGNLGSKKSGEVVASWDNGKLLLDFTHYTDDIDIYGGIIVNVDKIKKIQLPNTIDVSLKSSLAEMPEYSQVYSRWDDKDNSYYGSLNAQYLFNLPSFKTLHVFGKYKLTGIIPIGENVLVTVGNKSQLILTNNGNGLHNNTQDPATYIGYTQVGWQSGGTVAYNGEYQRNFIGESAFSVRYTGDITQSENQDIIAELVISSDNYTFSIKHSTDNSVISSVTGSTGNRVSALINQLNNLPNIECKFYNAANHKVSDLYVPSTPMLLVREVADGDTTVIDNPPAYFHYAIDRTEHTIEMFMSTEDGGKTYAAFDGKTIEFTTPALSDTTIKFGKLGVPVTWSDLHIRIDNQEDVEIVTVGSVKQLISNNNPKILILEGHSVDSCMDASPGYISDDLAASTDRLLYLFEQLKIRGYTPISINDFLEWKLNNRELPKRCYTIIMDDFQLGNYMISDHRYPFSKYDVKPTLALIENAHTRDDVMTFDSNQFTVGECLDAMKMNQWWQVSHGKHIRLGTVKMSEQIEHLNSCTYYCNKLGISSEVIVYPYGSYNNNLDALEHSNFKLGIAVVGNYYVCKANNNFYINRIDIGARTPIADIMAAIV